MSHKTETSRPRPTALEIDPSSPGTIVRAAMLLESCFNIFLAHGMFFHPHDTSVQLFFDGATTAASPSVADAALVSLLMQWIGTWTVATTVPLLLALPNRPGAIEKRVTAYAALGTMEALFVPFLVYHARAEGGGAAGLSWEKVFGGLVVPMVGALAFRLWVLFVKPGWMGRYRVVGGSAGKEG
ncbi:putative amidohydrolase family protein [Lasiodiplodia theobromae]|nr:putative amidohydrolase family protein [Lasiodiplodia theobromae]